ncbi:hypothetical protein [Amycolatopsis taiwanensis]|uniref:Uncharacterized protein n=1 Tax=Amycolatopsis taiwanensis TaxID=342230 RepID=A0A9W6R8K7_9PSEU|nr:hypothetical protein [Amycolatopsis taiwanensis]GLY69537.1 hypothetical protein Atai01_61560 [Amycolatopsis taiwanensis]
MPFDPNQPRDSRGRWTKGKAAGAGVALVAGVMTAAGGADVTTSVGAALDAGSSQGTAEQKAANGRKSAQKGNESEAWQRMALKEVRREVKRGLRCAAQSYGEVRQFFLTHPCNKLDQQLFALSDTQGNVIAGSIVWVTMPSAEVAAQFKELEDNYGTGDVTPFGTEILELSHFRFSGKHYKSRLDGPLVVIAETDRLRGAPSDAMLNEVASVADVLPPL